MILISPFNIKVKYNPLYKIGCSYSADGVNYSTSLNGGYVYNGGSFKVPLGTIMRGLQLLWLLMRA
jgi:hypothetical protein